MKNIIIIPDSFKGTVTSAEFCDIAKRVINRIVPQCKVDCLPVADGGEGSVDAFLTACGGEKRKITVCGPYMERVESFYGVLPDGTAVIEMAAAAGLPMVGDNKHAEKTSTYGVGELIVDAVEGGAKKIVLALGGSATNDGGCGAAAAVGVRFFDKEKNSFIPVGETLKDVCYIDVSLAKQRLDGVEITAMCDIDNPMYGPNGAAYVFAPQKGADEDCVKMLDAGLKSLAEAIGDQLGIRVDDIPGSGAAGGFGAGAVAFFDAKMTMGINTVLDAVDFDRRLEKADLVISGEGKLDSQSLRGKVVIGIAKRTKKKKVPLIAVVGDVGDSYEKAYEMGVSAIFSINRVAVPFSEARLRSKADLEASLEDIFRFAAVISG